MTARTDWRVEVRWEEELWYHEGDRSFCFAAAWAQPPYQAYVPTERVWDDVTPSWMRGRRTEVLDRIRAANDEHGHLLVEDDVGYRRIKGDG